MSERDDIAGKSGRQPAEGVRIIKAEEAQAALESGEVAGRRPDDQLRFGDVPPAPSGPRPAHRFPLPDSVDPSEAVALPPLATPRRPSDGPERRPPPPPAGSDWRVVTGDSEPDEAESETDQPSYDPPPAPAPGPEASAPVQEPPSHQEAAAREGPGPQALSGDAPGRQEISGDQPASPRRRLFRRDTPSREAAGPASPPPDPGPAPAAHDRGPAPPAPPRPESIGAEPAPAPRPPAPPRPDPIAGQPAPAPRPPAPPRPDPLGADPAPAPRPPAPPRPDPLGADPAPAPRSQAPAPRPPAPPAPGPIRAEPTAAVPAVEPPAVEPPGIWDRPASSPPAPPRRSQPAAAREEFPRRDEPVDPGPPPPPEASFERRSSWSPPPAPEPTVQEQEPSRNMERTWSSRPTPMFEGGDDRTTEMSVPEEGITVSGGTPDMPHWTDPPTGEVPRLRIEDDLEPGDEELDAWKSLGSRGVHWRDGHDWNEADALDDLAGDEEPEGVLDQTRAEHSDIYSFDEDFERVTSRTGSHPVFDAGDDFGDAEDLAPPAPQRSRGRASRPSRSSRRSAGRRAGAVAAGAAAAAAEEDKEAARLGGAHSIGARPSRGGRRTAAGGSREPAAPARSDRRSSGGRSGSDLGSRVGIGVGLVVLLIIAYAVGAKALLALSLIIVVAAAAEAYQMVRTAGFRPATLLGLVATAGCVLGAYWKGTGAIAVVSVFLVIGAMLWYVLRIVEARPLANVAVTVMVFVWVGVLGSFAAVMLAQPHGQGEFLGAIVVAVVADVCAYGVGRWIGSRPLAAGISPHKTVEGFIGGLIGALIAGTIIGKELAPWAGMKHGVILGLVIGLIAPVGDLFESMIKRDLGIKDSGTVLAGHGGLLDRFDGILVALPAAYFVITFFRL